MYQDAMRQPWLIAGIASNWASSPPKRSEAGRLATKIAARIMRKGLLWEPGGADYVGSEYEEDRKAAWLAARVVARMRLDEECSERGGMWDTLGRRARLQPYAKLPNRLGRLRPWLLGCPTMRASFGPLAGRLP